MHVYAIDPIDSWSGWQTVDEFNQRCDRNDYFMLEDTYALIAQAMRIARKEHGWEGDIRPGCGPYIAGIPTGELGVPDILIAWKQDNNGQTFVASPVELPWLRGDVASAVDFVTLKLRK